MITYYRCGVEGHKVFEFPKKKDVNKKSDARTKVTMSEKALLVGDNVIVLQQEPGENLMFKRALLRSEHKLVKELE